MFTSEKAPVNGKVLRRKLLSGAKDFAEKIIEDSKAKK